MTDAPTLTDLAAEMRACAEAGTKGALRIPYLFFDWQTSQAVITILDALDAANAREAEKDAEIARLRAGCSKENDDICQTLGRVLGYPRFCDDQENFPGATDENGVCVGDHVAASIAAEAAGKIVRLTADLSEEKAISRRLATTVRFGEAREKGVREDRERLTAELETTQRDRDEAQEANSVFLMRISELAENAAAEADLAALRATVERLCGALAEIGIAIFEQADDTLWLSDIETCVDRIFDLLGLSGDGDGDEQLKRLRRAAAERTRAIAEAREASADG